MKKGYFCIQNQFNVRCYYGILHFGSRSEDMTSRSVFLAVFALTTLSIVRAQDLTGYGYLALPVSARGLALGGTSLSVVEPEMSIAEQNPALLCPQMSGQAVLSYTNYMAGIQMGYAAYAGKFLNVGGWSAGLKFIDYGHFDGYDIQGISTGSFSVKDMSAPPASSGQALLLSCCPDSASRLSDIR